MKFSGVCYDCDAARYVAITDKGDLWAYGFAHENPDEPDNWEEKWSKICDGPGGDENESDSKNVDRYG